ncbi:MAG TPA: ABC transporter ATP-binding protein [Candidatus Pelethocola excrementipullorum]|nr:ABC transporter ATP-binding protein [Candidatus Pelethocola excrementipullorum]
MNNQNVLSVRNLSIEYKADRGQVHAVTDVSFNIRKGEFFGLAGESGCGKSTVAFSIMQLLKGAASIPKGEIVFNGKNILMFKPEELRLFRWEKTSMVLQSAMNNLNPVVTIQSQLADAILAHEKVSKAELKVRLKELVAMVNINENRLSSYPHELSGGMRQRVVIAMALALKPDLIIFDEPTTALDVVVQYNIIRKITELKVKMGFSIMFITHDLPLMLEMCDRIGIMYAGKMVEVSPVVNLLNRAAHPYTRGLLKSFPSLLGEKVRLEGIPGSVPDLITPPDGCLFYERCSEKREECRRRLPEFKEIGEHWFCACHNTKPKGAMAHDRV